MKKALALVLVLIFAVSSLVGCGDDARKKGSGNFTDVDYKVNEEAAKYSDSSEMPDWTGKQLELTMWYGAGSYSLKRNNIAKNDVVTDEIARVTGVRFSEDSYDNGGDMQDAKIAKIIAADTWPDVVMGCQGNVLEDLIAEDLLYDLTDLIPKYMPNLNALMEKGDFMKSTREDGKIYELYLNAPIEYMYPDMDSELIMRRKNPVSHGTSVLIRDDILKMLKPEAFTQDELISKFEQNGGFTEEEILNASFSSKEEFYQFLRDIKALNLKEGNREVYATYALSGSDNWDLLYYLTGGLYGYSGNSYFTYYDVETEKIEYMYDKPLFKDVLKDITELVREDVISQDSLVDNRAMFEEKCANGQYAILYGSTAPDVDTLNKNAKGYKYRKVNINIPNNENKFMLIANQFAGGYGYGFLKNRIKEEDMAQVLRYFDFMLTDVGQKLAAWGPKSAGLFEETEQGRRFINKELEAQAVYGEANDSMLNYGLMNKQWPGYPMGENRWDPIYVYDFVPNLTRMNYYYSTGTYNPATRIQGIDPAIWTLTNYVDEIARFWSARTAFEEDLTKIMTAKNDQEFETYYNKMVETGRRNGLSEDALAEANDVWRNQINKDYIGNIDEYVKNKK